MKEECKTPTLRCSLIEARMLRSLHYMLLLFQSQYKARKNHNRGSCRVQWAATQVIRWSGRFSVNPQFNQIISTTLCWFGSPISLWCQETALLWTQPSKHEAHEVCHVSPFSQLSHEKQPDLTNLLEAIIMLTIWFWISIYRYVCVDSVIQAMVL